MKLSIWKQRQEFCEFKATLGYVVRLGIRNPTYQGVREMA